MIFVLLKRLTGAFRRRADSFSALGEAEGFATGDVASDDLDWSSQDDSAGVSRDGCAGRGALQWIVVMSAGGADEPEGDRLDGDDGGVELVGAAGGEVDGVAVFVAPVEFHPAVGRECGSGADPARCEEASADVDVVADAQVGDGLAEVDSSDR